MGRRSKVIFHSFYCMKCGNKSYDLPRKKSNQKERFHRKKMYCPNCKIIVNHIECRNEEDVYDFELDFEEGLFKEEVDESLKFLNGENEE